MEISSILSIIDDGGEKTIIGNQRASASGFQPVKGTKGSASARIAPVFSFQLFSKKSMPWSFENFVFPSLKFLMLKNKSFTVTAKGTGSADFSKFVIYFLLLNLVSVIQAVVAKLSSLYWQHHHSSEAGDEFVDFVNSLFVRLSDTCSILNA